MCASSPSSPGSEVLIQGLSESDTSVSGKSRSTPSAGASLPSGGPTCREPLTFVRSHIRNETDDADLWTESEKSSALTAEPLNGIESHTLICSAFNLRGRAEGARPEMDDKASLRASSGGSSRSYLLTSSSAASLAKTSASPANAPGSAASAAASSGKSSASRKKSARRGASSRMFQGSLALTADGTWPRSWKDYGSAGLWSATGCWTAQVSEAVRCTANLRCRNEGGGSSLSAVLQRQVSPRYSLSPKSAAGILRRARKRGRDLPAPLAAALTVLADETRTIRTSSLASATAPTSDHSEP